MEYGSNEILKYAVSKSELEKVSSDHLFSSFFSSSSTFALALFLFLSCVDLFTALYGQVVLVHNFVWFGLFFVPYASLALYLSLSHSGSFSQPFWSNGRRKTDEIHVRWALHKSFGNNICNQ